MPSDQTGPEWDAYRAMVERAERVVPEAAADRDRWQAEVDAIAVRIRAEEWGTHIDEFGYPVPNVPDEYVGLAGEVQRAEQRRQGALADVEHAIAQLVATQALDVGDEIRSPFQWDGPLLKVADVLNRHAGQLCTAILSGDGRYVRQEPHQWPWDQEAGAIVRDPDVVGVRFEHWWLGGMRVGGLCHPTSRGVMDTDAVR